MIPTSELLPGYRVDPEDGAWLTLPWPDDLSQLPPSLGPQIIRWAEYWLIHPITGEQWRYTPGQKRFLHMWYAVSGEGRWIYTSGVKRGAKGTGKDPLLASMCLVECWGPVKFSHFEDGMPVGEARNLSLVQVAANSEGQAKDVLRVANAMISGDMQYEFDIDSGITRTQSPDGCRVEVVASSERSQEGDPATAGFLNESHHMTESSGGHRVAAVVRRNIAKSPKYIAARALEFTNAHESGQDSVAERSFEAWQAEVMGKTKKPRILYDSTEADPATDLLDTESLMRGLRQSYRDAEWVDLERIAEECLDLRTPLSDVVRYYFNGLGHAEDAWIIPKNFDRLANSSTVIPEKSQITMFLDCSKSFDTTALIGCDYTSGHVFTIGVWQRPRGADAKTWSVPREEVDAAVCETFEMYSVIWFGVDPSSAEDDSPDNDEKLYWMPYIDKWHQSFSKKLKVWASPGVVRGSSVMFDLRMHSYRGAYRNELFTQQCMLTQREIDEEASFTHDGHPTLRKHTFQARRRPNPWGVGLGKVTRDSAKFVDAATAMVGARMGRRLALNSGKVRAKTGRVMA